MKIDSENIITENNRIVLLAHMTVQDSYSRFVCASLPCANSVTQASSILGGSDSSRTLSSLNFFFLRTVWLKHRHSLKSPSIEITT